MSSLSKYAWRSDSLGLVVRMAMFICLMVLALGLVSQFLDWHQWPVSIREMWIAFGVTLIPIGTSLVLGEVPRGSDWVMVRLSLATFCRTGLPLFCVAVITLFSRSRLQLPALGLLTFFYVFGILIVVWISVKRLAVAEFESTKNDEVDRAPVE